jgi:hypothetical protein
MDSTEEIKKGKTYKCQECCRTYCVYSSYYSHMKKQHKKPTIACSVCSEMFHSKAELYRHTFLKHQDSQLPTEAMSTSVIDATTSSSFGDLLGMERAFFTQAIQPPQPIPRSNLLSSCFALDSAF